MSNNGTGLTETEAILQQVLRIEDVRTLYPDWLKYMKDGVIVDIHIGRPRFKERLTWEELGLEHMAGDNTDEIFQLGHKFLAPLSKLRAFNASEAKARTTLKAFSINSHWGAFVVVTAYLQCREALEEIQRQYFELADRFVEEYDNIKIAVLEGYRQSATLAYQNLVAFSPQIAEQYTEAQYVNKIVNTIRGKMLTAEQAREQFRFDIETSYIPLPAMLNESSAGQALFERQMQLDDAATEAQKYQDISEAERLELATREMHKDVLQKAYDDADKLVSELMLDYIKTLTERVYKAATDSLLKIKGSDMLHPRNAAQLNNMIAGFKNLNFVDNQELSAMIKPLEGMIDAGATGVELEEIKKKLEDISLLTRASLLDMGYKQKQLRGMLTPNSREFLANNPGEFRPPTEMQRRKSRGRLNLDDIKPFGDVESRPLETVTVQQTGRRGRF